MKRYTIHREEVDHLNLRSEEVRDIMGQIPSRLIRFGTSVIFIVVFLILISTCFFRYPDTINGHFVIHSSNPTLSLQAKVSGKIEKFFVCDHDSVKKGEMLAVISNTANQKDVFLLKKHLNAAWKNEIPYIDTLKLGEIQPFYILYGKALKSYRDFMNVDYSKQRIQLIQTQLQEKKKQLNLYIETEKLNQRSLGIENSTYQRQENIYKTGGISLAELEQGQSRVIQTEAVYNNARMARSQAEVSIVEIKQQILILIMQREQELCKYRDEMSEALENLKNAYREWENKYCVISDIDGIVSFDGVWKVHQNVMAGQNIMNVVPIEKNEIMARLFIPVEGGGKIREGDRINLAFADYPQEEYGVVHWHIEKLSLLPDTLYTSTLVLPDTLKTNYGKILPFHQNMIGRVTVITEDVSLFQRLINPLRSVFTKYNFETVTTKNISVTGRSKLRDVCENNKYILN